MAEVFTEVVIAPSFTAAASAAFADSPNMRLLLSGSAARRAGLDVRPLPAARSSRTATSCSETPDDWKVVVQREPTARNGADLELAWTSPGA